MAERMVPHFQEELEQLKTRLLEMGGLAEDRVRAAVQALVERDSTLVERVLAGDGPINQLHIEIDSRCFKLLALHQPMAVDLRAIVSAVKINTDLERVGDLAINIAEAARRYLRHPPVKELIDIPRMADIAQRHAARRARRLRPPRHRARPGGARRGRRAGRAEDAGLPRASDLHAAGPRDDRAVARPDPDLPPPRAHRRPRHQRRRGRDLHGLGARRPAPRREVETWICGPRRPDIWKSRTRFQSPISKFPDTIRGFGHAPNALCVYCRRRRSTRPGVRSAASAASWRISAAGCRGSTGCPASRRRTGRTIRRRITVNADCCAWPTRSRSPTTARASSTRSRSRTARSSAMDLRQIKVTPDEFGMMTYDPAFMNTAACKSRITYIDGDKGVLLVPRLPDRAAGRAQRLPRDRVPDPVRRAADRQRSSRRGRSEITLHTMLHTNITKLMEGFRHDAHPMGMFISTVGALSTFYPDAKDIFSAGIAAAADDPADRQGAEHRRLRLPPLDRPAVQPAGQRAELRRQLPEHAVQDDRAEVQAEPGARARARRAVHPARRPRAELQHQHDARHRQLARRSLLGARRRGGGALRPAARRRQRSGAADAARRSARSTTSRRSSSASRRAKAA